MKIISLANAPEFIEQYVELRNTYKERLFTTAVTKNDTVLWLANSDVYVGVAIDNRELVGAVVLYLSKDAELAIFTKYHNQGIGTKLLRNIKMVARQIYSLEYIWAWVAIDNTASSSLFLKCGFSRVDNICRQYAQKTLNGNKFECRLDKK